MKPKTSVKIGIALSIVVAFLFLASGMTAPMSSGMQANNFTAAKGIQPYVTLNSNVTWSTFTNGWGPLEYNNGSTRGGNLTLNTGFSTLYANPISVNPTDIIADGTLQNDHLGTDTSLNWNNTWGSRGTPAGGAVFKNGYAAGKEYMSLNTSKSASNFLGIYMYIPLTAWPSQSTEYDALTYAITFSGTALTGIQGGYEPANATQGNGPILHPITPGQTQYYSQTIKEIAKEQGINMDMTTKDIGNAPLQFAINLPETTTADTLNLTVSALAITEKPLTLGTTYQDNQIIPFTNSTGAAYLNNFNPNFKWSSIANGGYTVATSQPMQKPTVEQNALSGSNYIEQVEYQGSFGLPIAPDLTFGATTLTEQFNISTSQVQVLDINGQSFLSSITGKNGTITLITAANPTQTTSYLEIVDYTSSQWQSISGPPGFFSVAGIEYYFDELVLGTAAFLGLGATAAALKVRQLRRAR